MIFCNVSGPRSKTGGIGNNFFKIATALSFSKRHNVEACFSEWRYDIFRKDRVKFGTKREHINIENAYNELSFSFSPIPFKDNLEIRGYFQSEKYFEGYKEYIFYCFEPKEEIKDYLKKKYGWLISQDTVAIHVRRGDYLTNPLHPVLQKEYFEESIKKMPKQYLKVIFSDDIQWCKNNLDKDCYFVENEEDYIDLFLMSECNYHIISNSSFSWWGAYLGKKSEKKVIAPKNWFGGSLSSMSIKDIIPKGWNLV